MNSTTNSGQDQPSRLIALSAAPFAAATPLPSSLTSLIGRVNEVETIVSLLRRDDIRLVTLTGFGGVGKTRLALEVAAMLTDDFADGVRFIPLDSVLDPTRVPDRVASALGIGEVGRRSAREAIVDALSDAEMLLVFDNFEHVLPAADFLRSVLGTCFGLTVLVTSRTLLRISGEHAVPVPPLNIPAPQPDVDLAEMSRVPAVRLFAERATAVVPSFALTSDSVPLVADICRHLDGLPLAIELAAARVNVLPLTTIRTRLDQRLPLLTGGARDAPRRHQTMRDAIGWSYELLTEEEQTLFRRLGVFVGGFTLEAAEAVGRGEAEGVDGSSTSYPFAFSPPAALSAVIDLLGSLVDSSLVRLDDGRGQEPRYRMLETVRAFAVEQMERRGEEAIVRHRHADWCLTFVNGFGAGDITMLADVWWLPSVESEHDNIRSALTWLEQIGDRQRMLQIAVATRPLWEARGHHLEAIGWLGRGLARSEDALPDVQLNALIGLGRHLVRVGRYDEARERCQAALGLARRQRDQRAEASALYMLGVVETNHEHYDQAQSYFEESLVIHRQFDDRVGICGAHYFLGIVAYGQDKLDDAIDQIERALTIRRAEGPIFNLFVLLNALGLLYCEHGDLDRGANTLGESSSVWQRGVGTNRDSLAEWLAVVGRMEMLRHRFQHAARLFGAAEALSEAVGVPLVVPPPSLYRRQIATLERELGTGPFGMAWTTGQAFMTSEAVAEALKALNFTVDIMPTSLGLTAREADVLRLLALGLPDREIAEELSVSVRTVEGHVARLLGKLGVHTRTAAVSAATAAGFLPSN